jgi:hypothetical protein
MDRKLADIDRNLSRALDEAEQVRAQISSSRSQEDASPALLAHGHLTRCMAELEAARSELRSFARSSRDSRFRAF